MDCSVFTMIESSTWLLSKLFPTFPIPRAEDFTKHLPHIVLSVWTEKSTVHDEEASCFGTSVHDNEQDSTRHKKKSASFELVAALAIGRP